MAAAQVPSTKLVLEPNVPQRIALKYPAGKIVESRFSEEKQVYFSLVDGRAAYLSLGVAQSITNLGLDPREEFFICKYWNGDKRQVPRINVWLTPEGEKARIAQEEPEHAIPAEDPPSELEQQLARSLAEIQARKRAEVQRLAAPPPDPTPTLPAALQGWSAALLDQTNALVDVYAQACRHAETLNVPAAVVRTVMISAFIGLQRTGGNRG